MEPNDSAKPRVFSIGHSNHAADRLLSLLQSHGIQVVVDTRSQPYSQYNPHFDQEDLRKGLTEAGIRYLFLGRELGGRPEGDEFYDENGHVLYDRVAATPLFQEGLNRLERGLRDYKVAMLCAEESPAECHRRLLIGRVLIEHGIQVNHIRGDGRVQSEEEIAAQTDPDRNQLSLFHETPSKFASA